ncbi:CU044_2847 family protein [Streptomyces sp. NBC_01268]|uniref:CU044_2847 family protein n=1 Tax=Streptomyces sp. NBC_01268 TaxID=2903806 RepID=UPI002E36D60F|nr:CU044_2847 family protein [Streptomyces sp. NBC_01268]
MTEMTKVELADGVLYVEVEPLVPARGSDELEGLHDRLPDLSGVTAALSSFAGQLGDALHQAAPDRAVVEFGCQLGVEAGKLTALVVQGTATANLKVTLEWAKEQG